MQAVKWGILGTAMIAVNRTMPAMKDAPSAQLAAVASRDGAKARQVAQALGVPRAYGSYEELIADPAIDAIYIPLPNHLHFEWCVRALEAGKHVLCEKPLCLSPDDIAALCRVRDRTGRHIEEAFAYRNHPQWTKIDELLRSNAIGAVRAVHGTMALQFHDPADIRNNPAQGGGALYDMGSYLTSACSMLLGRPAQRVVAALDIDPVFKVDRLSTALLDYGDAHASFTAGIQSGPSAWGTHQQLSVLGSNGWLRCDFPLAHARPTACHIHLGDATSVGSFETATFSFEPVNQYTQQIERFSRLVRGEPVKSWPIEDALTTMRTITALFESARSGQWQTLDTTP